MAIEAKRSEWRLDVSGAVPGDEALEVAASLIAPADRAPKALLLCLPGGYLSRHYFDLGLDGDHRYSFAEHMAGHGFASLALDHLGIGDSARPRDGWVLRAETVARANQRALDEALARWQREGGSALPTIGVGHSMGSCLSVVQQAEHAPHRALVLFSFTTLGLRPFLQGHEAEVADDPEAIAARIEELARERFGGPYPADAPEAETPAFSAGTAGPDGERALASASAGLLPIPGLLSMIPGGYRPWAEQVRCPTFVAVGDHDLHSAQKAPASLPHAPEVVAYTLEDCWHCHTVANTREKLFTRIARWIDHQLAADA